jgi:hypothetical protein
MWVQVPRGKLLGLIVSERGVESNPENISAITNMGPIQSIKDIQQLMGCFVVLSKFIFCLEEGGIALYKLLKKFGSFQ